MDNKKTKELRSKIAIANACRTFLYFNDFLSDTENDKIHKKISKYQDKNKIAISREQLDSVEFICKYNKED